MPKFLPLLTVASLSVGALAAQGQETSAATPVALYAANTDGQVPETKPAGKPKFKPTPTVTPAPTVAPEATPAPKKLTFFQRLFGVRKPKATPAPATPAASPTPTPKKDSKKPTATPKPGATPAPEMPVAVATPKTKGKTPSATPAPEKPLATPKPEAPSATPPPIVPPPTKKTTKTKADPVKSATDETPDLDSEAKDRARFDAAKTKALEDPQIQSLKTKADNAATDEDSRKSLRAYNKALFEKIRKVDSGVSDRASRMEAAIMKRLSE